MENEIAVFIISYRWLDSVPLLKIADYYVLNYNRMLNDSAAPCCYSLINGQA
jgi:hypothetical protein